MNHFIEEFEQLLTEYNCGSATRVFEIAGLDRATLSRVRNAGFKIQFDDLKPLAAAMSRDEMVYLRLFRARLLDECTDPRAGRIAIEISGAAMQPQELREGNYLPPLPKKLEAAMVGIAQALPKDAGLRRTVSYLGNTLFKAERDAPALSKGHVNYPKAKKTPLSDGLGVAFAEAAKRSRKGGSSAR